MPVDERGRVGLLRQFRPVPAARPSEARYPLGELGVEGRGFWSWEVARGFPEKGEMGVDAALREVGEEMAVSVRAVRPLGWLNVNTALSMTDQPVYVVLVDGEGREGAGVPEEEGEVIEELRWFDVAELKRFVLDGNIRCSMTMGALSYFFAADDVVAELACSGGASHVCLDSDGDSNDVGKRGVAWVAGLFACLMWELDLGVDLDLKVDYLKYVVSSRAERDKVAAGLMEVISGDGKGVKSWPSDGVNVIFDLGESPLVAGSLSVRKIEIACIPPGSASAGRHILALLSSSPLTDVCLRHRSLSWIVNADHTTVTLPLRNLSIDCSLEKHLRRMKH